MYNSVLVLKFTWKSVTLLCPSTLDQASHCDVLPPFIEKFSLYDSSEDCSSCSIPKSDSFNRGLLLGDAQNLARHLMELPSNMLTPSIFAEKAKAELEPLGVKVNVYDSDWIKNQKMNAFWSVAKGSTEEPKMVEMIYEGK